MRRKPGSSANSSETPEYDIVHFDRGQTALAAIEQNPPDAILLDLMLPDMDGIDILRRVANRQLPCVTVVVTAHGSINVAVEAMRLGAYDFIVKPFNAARLQVTLRNALEHDRLSRILETYHGPQSFVLLRFPRRFTAHAGHLSHY